MLQPIYNQDVNGSLAFEIFNSATKGGGNESNAGLWFDRFYTYERYDVSGELLPDSSQKEAKKSEKDNFWKDFNGNQGARKCGNQAMLASHAVRQFQLCQTQGGISNVFTNDWLMAIGLGNSHPLENGLLWHPSLGVPYFQGATVKGMAKALMERWGAEPKLINRWFGSVNLLTSPNYEGKEETAFNEYFSVELTESLKESLDDERTGAFIFMDAIPTAPVMVKRTMVTPHYGKWYEKGDTSPTESEVLPGDWHAPIPVEFLAVEKATMQFGIMPRLGATIYEGEIEQVANVIILALKHLGIGAKTGTGFGRMQLDDKETRYLKEQFEKYSKELEQQIELAKSMEGASVLKQELIQQISDNNWRDSKDEAKTSFTAAIDDWLDKLEESPDDKGSIDLMIEIFKIHYASQFNKPNKIKKERQKVWVNRLKDLQMNSKG